MYLFCIALQLYFGLKTEQDDSSLVLGISTQPTPEHFLDYLKHTMRRNDFCLWSHGLLCADTNQETKQTQDQIKTL